ncbi:hypothetical protein [Massilia pseudoviolaceinigra]|uniref:hypothetical protein n=1 Tax=Massilia pseudoviolaceinigra TaxID=3057165 RepID=UPI002796A749|nr:hypothetical protein [Massilia sp. CCM 9206]MDQ1920421.1 hypothetical protein [Massilia sp. CCM 9206]
MTAVFRLTSLVAAAALAVQLAGCAQSSMAVPAATRGNTVKLYNANFDKVAVGSFTFDASQNPALDKRNTIRAAGVLYAPGGSFAQHLGNTLKANLLAASLLDANAPTVITGTMTLNRLNAAVGSGKSVLAARFIVTRAGAVRYDQELKVESRWNTSIGAESLVQQAKREYELLFSDLVGELLDDDKFRVAISK